MADICSGRHCPTLLTLTPLSAPFPLPPPPPPSRAIVKVRTPDTPHAYPHHAYHRSCACTFVHVCVPLWMCVCVPLLMCVCVCVQHTSADFTGGCYVAERNEEKKSFLEVRDSHTHTFTYTHTPSHIHTFMHTLAKGYAPLAKGPTYVLQHPRPLHSTHPSCR
jgi:hypothetical protein